MIKRANLYWLALLLIIVIQLLVPPNIGKIYFYFIILIAAFFLNGGYKLLIDKLNPNNDTGDKSASKLFQNMDFRQFSLQMNNIAVSTLLYFMYIQVTVLSKAINKPSGLINYEYMYRGESYFMTFNEADALHFWEFASFLLIISSIVIRIIDHFIKRRYISITSKI